jgi:ABC-type uncharacterized transport system permease subunit
MIRYLNYIKENLRIMFIHLKEYKANLYSAIFLQIIFIASQILFFYVFATNFGDTIGWNFEHFLIFMFIFDMVWCIAGIVVWKYEISQFLLNGEMNSLLVKPVPVALQYYFSKMNSSAITFAFSNLILITIAMIYYGIPFSINYILISLLMVFALFMVAKIVDGAGLIKPKAENFFGEILTYRNWDLQQNPAPLFKNFKYKNILLIYPAYTFGLLFLSLVEGKDITNYILYLIAFILVTYFVGKTLWKIGLKKYEAYG